MTLAPSLIYVLLFIPLPKHLVTPHFEKSAVPYSYNKSQRDALVLNIILAKKNSTCFGEIYCPSSGVLILYSQQLVFVILVMLPVCYRGKTGNIT